MIFEEDENNVLLMMDASNGFDRISRPLAVWNPKVSLEEWITTLNNYAKENT